MYIHFFLFICVYPECRRRELVTSVFVSVIIIIFFFSLCPRRRRSPVVYYYVLRLLSLLYLYIIIITITRIRTSFTRAISSRGEEKRIK